MPARTRLVQIARSAIAVHGVYIQWVEADKEEPCFAYTAGLASYDHPESTLFGWDPTTA